MDGSLFTLSPKFEWKFVVSATMQLTTSRFLVLTSPLLEEERNIVASANIMQSVDPFLVHRPRPRARLATDDRPMNLAQVNVDDPTDKRLKRYESRSRGYRRQV